MEDKYFVKYVYYKDNDNEEHYICTQSSYSFGEMIKYLHYCEKYKVLFYPYGDDDEKINKKDLDYLSTGSYIENFYVNFGNDDYFPMIVVELR